jgi:hypothetical protein
VNDGRVTEPADFEHTIRVLEPLFRVVNNEVREHGHERFHRQRVVERRLGEFREQNLSLRRDFDARLLGNPVGSLPDRCRIHRHLLAIDNEVGDFLGFFRVKEVAVVLFQNPLKLGSDFLVNDCRLFRRTNHTVIESFGNHQVGTSALNIDVLVDITRHVPRPDSQCGFPAGVGRFHHSRTARRENQRHAPVVHECGSRLH